VQIVSDLHMEFNDGAAATNETFYEYIKPAAPILALLGDIGTPAMNAAKCAAYANFLLRCADDFEIVLVLAGNHEYYTKFAPPDSDDDDEVARADTGPLCVVDVNRMIRQICARRANIVFLHRKSLVVNGVRIVGATLWTDTNVAAADRFELERVMNDYRMCCT
jgi:hypothetical protein